MGSVYAALFASAGHEVWAIDRWREHVDAMRSGGLRLEGASGERTVRLNATTDPRDAGPCDLVILATFGEMDSEEAKSYEPKIVMVDEKNRIKTMRQEIPGPQMPPRIEA